MKLLATVFALSALVSATSAQTIATCQDPDGYSYYHYSGVVPKGSSGFTQDKITGGRVSLQKLGAQKYDIVFSDAASQAKSTVADGGEVILLRKGRNDATFGNFYPGGVIEIYTFWVDADGQKKYDLVQSKGGNVNPIHKISILVGMCSQMNLQAID